MKTRTRRSSILVSLFVGLAIQSTFSKEALDDLAPGAIFEVYQISESLSAIPTIQSGELPNAARMIASVDLSSDRGDFAPCGERLVSCVRGVMRVPRGGRYEFRMNSDDGSRLEISGEVIVNFDGLQVGVSAGGIAVLRRGDHPFSIEHFDAGGPHKLILEWRPPGARSFAVAPAALFFHDPTQLSKTSEGLKAIEIPVAPTEGLDRAERISRAIELGTDWLQGEVDKLQVFEEVNVKDKSAQVAFETYALVVAGVSVGTPLIAGNFRHLERTVDRRNYTYGVCSEIFARDAVIAQLEEDVWFASGGTDEGAIGRGSIGRVHRKTMATLTRTLVDSQNSGGGWHYFPHESDADISCTQFVVLALAIAASRGIEVSPKTWARVGDYLLSLQKSEGPVTEKRVVLVPHDERPGTIREKEKSRRGGTAVDPDSKDRALVGGEGIEVRAREFEYSPGHPEGTMANRWNRVCAGTSSLMVVRDFLGTRLSGDRRSAIEAGIRDGLGWMLENWNPFGSYYGVYSLEKVGDIGHVQSFAGVDWYEACTTWLLEEQRTDGSWPGSSMWGESPRVGTAFALLILRRASSILSSSTVDRMRRPIVTGEGAERTQTEKIEWVYLPELEVNLSWPELLRVLKRRPRRSSLQMIEAVVEGLTPDRRGALIPDLVVIRDRLDKKGLRSFDRLLEEILGFEVVSDEACLEWHRDWLEAHKLAGKDQDPSFEELEKLYSHEPASFTLREIVVRAALRYGVRELVPVLLADLEASTVDLRRVSYLGLRGFFPEGFPEFDPKGKKRTRAEQIRSVRAFVERQMTAGTD